VKAPYIRPICHESSKPTCLPEHASRVLETGMFDRYIGIDYSGAETPTASLKGLRVYMVDGPAPAREIQPPGSPRRYWTRQGIAEWLVERLSENIPTVVGIDHGFSFPIKYFERHHLPMDWQIFLEDFQRHWPAGEAHVYVDFLRENNPRTGNSKWRRLAEIESKAKSVFHFDVQGSVAKSTHSGLPWLLYIRNQLGKRINFWPFDAWQIPVGKSVVAEVYPALWNKGYPPENRDSHQHDAFCVAEALRRADQDGTIKNMFEPDLSERDLQIASIEGWILGLGWPTKSRLAHNSSCVFCQRSNSDQVIARNGMAVAFPDGYPLSSGHTLIVPLRHVGNFFQLTKPEQQAVLSLMRSVQKKLNRKYSPDGFNVGINVGKAAGQTVDHVHIHLIPRYSGDVPDPRGGVRWVIPLKARYWSEP
jgi:diadenosine tetraphosphate (Ap4A) HIT family hydrolase